MECPSVVVAIAEPRPLRPPHHAYVGNGRSSQLTADTAKIVAIEKIGFAVLAQSQDQALVAARARNIERKGIAASEILIVSVEHFPIYRR